MSNIWKFRKTWILTVLKCLLTWKVAGLDPNRSGILFRSLWWYWISQTAYDEKTEITKYWNQLTLDHGYLRRFGPLLLAAGQAFEIVLWGFDFAADAFQRVSNQYDISSRKFTNYSITDQSREASGPSFRAAGQARQLVTCGFHLAADVSERAIEE